VKQALSHVQAVKVKVQTLTAESIMSAKDRSRLHHVINHSLSNFSDAKLQGYSDVYSKPLKCLNNFKQRLICPREVISKEAGFLVFMLSKVFTFASGVAESAHITSYQKMMSRLVSMEGENQKLSYQVLQDLLSEVYRLCYRARLISCQQRLLRSSVKTIDIEQVFLSEYDHPSCRMSKKHFASHSRILEVIPRCRSMFESTDDFIRDVEYFQPVISSGCWQKCEVGHYYCIPVCKPGRIDMKCPECTGNG
jgi:hypothetical protein